MAELESIPLLIYCCASLATSERNSDADFLADCTPLSYSRVSSPIFACRSNRSIVFPHHLQPGALDNVRRDLVAGALVLLRRFAQKQVLIADRHQLAAAQRRRVLGADPGALGYISPVKAALRPLLVPCGHVLQKAAYFAGASVLSDAEPAEAGVCLCTPKSTSRSGSLSMVTASARMLAAVQV